MSVDREAAGAAPKGEREFRSKTTGWVARITLVAASVLASLALLEVGYRLVLWGPGGLANWPNLAHQRMGIGAGDGGCQYAYDGAIGWTSPANCVSNVYNSDADGFRRTTARASLAEPPILVTGSSFAKGDEVNDDEAWPAYLQDLIGRKVVNAGVSGYAFDQMVLSTEQLVPKVKPLFIIASFTPGDIRRAEMKVAWNREKPYFTVEGGQLELHNVPVPGKPGEPVRFPAAAEWFGRFALAELVAGRLGVQRGWYFREVRGRPGRHGRCDRLSVDVAARRSRCAGGCRGAVQPQFLKGERAVRHGGSPRRPQGAGLRGRCGAHTLRHRRCVEGGRRGAWRRRLLPHRSPFGRGQSPGGGPGDAGTLEPAASDAHGKVRGVRDCGRPRDVAFL
jgi:hypothetical protein